MTLEEVKTRWNEVLDEILRQDRILWLALFDARLANFSNGVLTLDFLDSGKLAGEHDYSFIRGAEQLRKVQSIAQNILGVELTIVIK